MRRSVILTMLVLTAVAAVFAQSESSYDVGAASTVGTAPTGGTAPTVGTAPSNGDDAVVGLLDPSRFTVNHSMSFMAGGSQMSSVKSQSVYSTMMRYKFDAPVVLSLNFDMPLHSTFNRYNNLTEDNMASLEYFKNMPIDASLSWFPKENLMFRVSVIKMPEAGYFYNGMYRPGSFYRY